MSMEKASTNRGLLVKLEVMPVCVILLDMKRLIRIELSICKSRTQVVILSVSGGAGPVTTIICGGMSIVVATMTLIPMFRHLVATKMTRKLHEKFFHIDPPTGLS